MSQAGVNCDLTILESSLYDISIITCCSNIGRLWTIEKDSIRQYKITIGAEWVQETVNHELKVASPVDQSEGRSGPIRGQMFDWNRLERI